MNKFLNGIALLEEDGRDASGMSEGKVKESLKMGDFH